MARNARPGFKQARVIEVKQRWSEPDGLGDRREFAGHVTVELSRSGLTYTFIDGSMNAAPESLHRVGARCWLGWRKGASYSLPYVEEWSEPGW